MTSKLIFATKGSTKPEPTDKPSKETKPDKEVTGSEGEGTKPGGGEQGGNETQPGKEGGEEKIENISDFCKTKSDGIYGDPTDCRYFIKCANSKTYRTKCANGLHWNDKIKNCDFPANAGCSKQNEKEQRGQQAGAGDSSQGNDEVGCGYRDGATGGLKGYIPSTISPSPHQHLNVLCTVVPFIISTDCFLLFSANTIFLSVKIL